jgi:hypothetical protein
VIDVATHQSLNRVARCRLRTLDFVPAAVAVQGQRVSAVPEGHLSDFYPASNPQTTDYPAQSCAPGRDRIYPATYISVEQLLRRGKEGLWFVTDVRPTELRQVIPPRPSKRSA